MALPFSQSQFLEVFAVLNRTVWPAQIVAYLLGIAAVLFCFWRVPFSHRIVAGILGLFWIFNGAVYHLLLFSKVNPGARLFGAIFIVQGAMFWWLAAASRRYSFEFQQEQSYVAGLGIVLYAMIGYPVLNILLGHRYPEMPVFGLTPCPTTIFTFGILVLSRQRFPNYLLVIPVLWSVVGVSAAIQLEIPEDYGLPVAALVATATLFIWRKPNRRMQMQLG